jgi:hypothetical protein
MHWNFVALIPEDGLHSVRQERIEKFKKLLILAAVDCCAVRGINLHKQINVLHA